MDLFLERRSLRWFARFEFWRYFVVLTNGRNIVYRANGKIILYPLVNIARYRQNSKFMQIALNTVHIMDNADQTVLENRNERVVQGTSEKIKINLNHK